MPICLPSPSFLFRTWGPSTNGENNEDGFKSAASSNGLIRTTSAGLSRSTLRHLLCCHVQWSDQEEDIYVSFSDSLMFALQHGIRRIFMDEVSTPENTFLTLVRTCGVGGRFSNVEALFQKYEISDEPRGYLDPYWYRHEYVVEGELDISSRSVTVSFQTIADCNIFNAYHDFKDPSYFTALASRCEVLNRIWRTYICPIGPSEKKAITSLGSFLGRGWHFPIALSCLSMMKRSLKDWDLLVFLDSMASGKGQRRPVYRERSNTKLRSADGLEIKSLAASFFVGLNHPETKQMSIILTALRSQRFWDQHARKPYNPDQIPVGAGISFELEWLATHGGGSFEEATSD